MRLQVPKIAREFNIKFGYSEEIELHQLKRLQTRLERVRKRQNIEFVHGRGSRKTTLQRAIECITTYYDRLKKYRNDLSIMEDRNSFSKTDHDATFMRMKDDPINGQSKPAYNVTIGVDAEYIVDVMISQDRNDYQTLIPFLERIKRLKYREIVADAGYEGEESYAYLEENAQLPFIKPKNYESSKTEKYRSDISLRENMPYDWIRDCYTCHMVFALENTGIKKSRTKAGYQVETTVYECSSCEGCAVKDRCIRLGAGKQVEVRRKHIRVSKEFIRQRSVSDALIRSERGILLCINRSIQVEGAFGVIKQDMGFRRFLLRGKKKVQTEIMLLCFAYNMMKLHNKIQSGRCGAHLHFSATA